MQFEVREADAYGPHPVFVLKSNKKMTEDAMLRAETIWVELWKRVGMKPPVFVILDAGMELEAVSDAELRDRGLMRIFDTRSPQFPDDAA
ncbi:MAG: hypothetical protein JOY66_06450 [Acetobacteraceae bacterium]|nr:hypothetical protein [Acetobacteraceae bacterium]